MTALEYREPTLDEAEAFWLPTITAFGMHPDQEKTERWRPILGTGLAVGALDAGQWVGGTSAFVDEVVLPGGATLPAALVTMVGVLTTHRRRGVLRELMKRQLDAAAGKGLPLAALLASESTIYGRYGYGPATWAATYEVHTAKAAFAEPVTASVRSASLARPTRSRRCTTPTTAASPSGPARWAAARTSGRRSSPTPSTTAVAHRSCSCSSTTMATLSRMERPRTA